MVDGPSGEAPGLPERLLEGAEVEVGDWVLILGRGAGNAVRLVPPGAGVVMGMDSELAPLREGAARAEVADQGHLRFVAGHASRLPFQSRGFERVVVLDAMDVELLGESARVLVPGGRLVWAGTSQVSEAELRATGLERPQEESNAGMQAGIGVQVALRGH